MGSTCWFNVYVLKYRTLRGLNELCTFREGKISNNHKYPIARSTLRGTITTIFVWLTSIAGVLLLDNRNHWTMQPHRRLEQRPRFPRRPLRPRQKKHHPRPELEPRSLHLRRKMTRKVAVIQWGILHQAHHLESLWQAPPEQHHQVSTASSSCLIAFTGRVAMSDRFGTR